MFLVLGCHETDSLHFTFGPIRGLTETMFLSSKCKVSVLNPKLAEETSKNLCSAICRATNLTSIIFPFHSFSPNHKITL